MAHTHDTAYRLRTTAGRIVGFPVVMVVASEGGTGHARRSTNLRYKGQENDAIDVDCKRTTHESTIYTPISNNREGKVYIRDQYIGKRYSHP